MRRPEVRSSGDARAVALAGRYAGLAGRESVWRVATATRAPADRRASREASAWSLDCWSDREGMPSSEVMTMPPTSIHTRQAGHHDEPALTAATGPPGAAASRDPGDAALDGSGPAHEVTLTGGDHGPQRPSRSMARTRASWARDGSGRPRIRRFVDVVWPEAFSAHDTQFSSSS